MHHIRGWMLVSINTLDQHWIDSSIVTCWTLDWHLINILVNTWSTLNQHLSQQLVKSWLTYVDMPSSVNWYICVTHQVTNLWPAVNRIMCWSGVNWDVDWVVNWDVNRVLIKGIDGDSTAVTFSSHDLKEIVLKIMLSLVEMWNKSLCSKLLFLVYWNRIWDKQYEKYSCLGWSLLLRKRISYIVPLIMSFMSLFCPYSLLFLFHCRPTNS